MKLLGFYEGKAVIIDAPYDEVKRFPYTEVTWDMLDWYNRQVDKEEVKEYQKKKQEVSSTYGTECV